jgi:hypothetical protein
MRVATSCSRLESERRGSDSDADIDGRYANKAPLAEEIIFISLCLSQALQGEIIVRTAVPLAELHFMYL